MDTAGSSSFVIPTSEDYESEFEFDAEVGEKRRARHDLATNVPPPKAFKPKRESFHDECSREQGRLQQQAYLALDAYTRHKKLINEYVLCYKGATDILKRSTVRYKTDQDVIRENHRFLWEEDEDAGTWGQQLAKKYYDRLFKEYCLCDLSRYKDKKIGMRWRTEKEVILGKGQFFCGSVNCESQDELETWEVLFGYQEHGEKKSALVKLRLCQKCSYKLHYGYKGKASLKQKKKHKVREKVEESPSVIVENGETAKVPDKSGESDIWKEPIKEDVEQSKEEVFEEFLEDLFL